MNDKRKFRSISVKLVFMLGLSAFIAITTTSIVLFWYKYNQNKEQAVETLSQTVGIMGENLTASLEFDDAESAKTTLSALKLSGEIDSAYILKDNKIVFASYIKNGIDETKIKYKISSIASVSDMKKELKHIDIDNVIVNKPIYLKNKYLASFVIVSNTSEIKRILLTQLLMQTGTSVIVLLIIILLAFRLQKIFTLPIFRLKDAMDEVREHANYNAKVGMQTNDEFQSLIDGFDKMLDTIKNQKK